VNPQTTAVIDSNSHDLLRQVGSPEFHSLGVAGAIDGLTAVLRDRGITVVWHTKCQGMEIKSAMAYLLYRAAAEILAAIFLRTAMTRVTIRLVAVYHGIRLSIEDDSQPQGEECEAVSRSIRTAIALVGGSAKKELNAVHEPRYTVTLPLD
jgi:signal transduction histidine kinase